MQTNKKGYKTMNKTILIYFSKTGFTKRYAEWIAEELSCRLVPFSDRKTVSLSDYDTILFGSSFHAGLIRELNWFKKQLPALTGKKIAVFATGGMPASAPDIPKAFEQNFTASERKVLRTFYLPGGMCYEKIGFGDKLMMSVFCKMIKKKEGADSEMYRMISGSYDISDRTQISPIIEYCR